MGNTCAANCGCADDEDNQTSVENQKIIIHNNRMVNGVGHQNTHFNEKLYKQQSLRDSTGHDQLQVEDRPPFTFENGAVYVGQWLGENRHGFGT